MTIAQMFAARPLMFVWPYWPLYWAVSFWAFAPEMGIVRRAIKPAKQAESKDGGSLRIIAVGGMIGMLLSLAFALMPALHMPEATARVMYFVGVALVIGASLLRRHCFRQLGASFTGDVRAEADQKIVTTGAYAWLRHPSYTAGILMNTAMGFALGSWASAAVLTVAGFAVYRYRIVVEERALLAAIGEPYRVFMSTRRRLIPFLY